jgi:glycine betaine/choline ABC-type transport system substrate-binding protein
MRPVKMLIGLLALATVLGAACGEDAEPDASANNRSGAETTTTATGRHRDGEPVVRIGAQDFGESAILAAVYGQALEANEFDVQIVDVDGLRQELLAAFEDRDVNLSLEYAASMLEHVNEGAGQATADADETVTLLEGHLADLGLHAPQPSAAIGTNPIALTASSSAQRSASAPLADNVVPVVADELVEAYGFDFLDLLDEISQTIDTAALRAMNERFETDGLPAEDIARDFLAETDLGE